MGQQKGSNILLFLSKAENFRIRAERLSSVDAFKTIWNSNLSSFRTIETAESLIHFIFCTLGFITSCICIVINVLSIVVLCVQKIVFTSFGNNDSYYFFLLSLTHVSWCSCSIDSFSSTVLLVHECEESSFVFNKNETNNVQIWLKALSTFGWIYHITTDSPGQSICLFVFCFLSSE